MSEKKILLLGAGLVTEPLVGYLLNVPGFRLTIATRTVSKAEKLIKGHSRGVAKSLDVSNEASLEAEIMDHDLTISLLPATMHPIAARMCLKHRKHLVTTSYVSPIMKGFHEEAVSKGLIFLNELGLDPGIDHMSAMRIIHTVEAAGGQVTGFRSYCGGLPAPEANTNPFGYKFSWAPRGVILASRNPAHFLWNGIEKDIPGVDLFTENHPLEVGGMAFEAYPNRDSMPYQAMYGLEGVHTMFRGTLRNPGWCKTMKTLVDFGYLDLTEKRFAASTYRELFHELLGTTGDPRKAAANQSGLPEHHFVFDRMEWMGLFSTDPLQPDTSTALDHLTHKCLEKLQFAPGERDMIVLHHIFEAQIGEETKTITSTLIDYGVPHGQTAMARTVSLPAAIGTRLILQNKLTTPGVLIPVSPDIYHPVLDELDSLGIHCIESGLE
ncbi:saccharopine dehydrogenase NADP-binding domain-containing protein [bacterium]|nr:saccharopine dehydrogenase NADP-binding domain-containing protein [candidate division CSSED10-310 bacterium]